jgi:hypothetical protein
MAMVRFLILRHYGIPVILFLVQMIGHLEYKGGCTLRLGGSSKRLGRFSK